VFPLTAWYYGKLLDEALSKTYLTVQTEFKLLAFQEVRRDCQSTVMDLVGKLMFKLSKNKERNVCLHVCMCMWVSSTEAEKGEMRMDEDLVAFYSVHMPMEMSDLREDLPNDTGFWSEVIEQS
jgi:hypothetical protein